MAGKLKEVRVRFSDDEIELYEYISSKRSATGFLKDLAEIEMKKERNTINNVNEIALEVVKLLKDKNLLNITDDKELMEAVQTIEIDKAEDFKDNIEDEFDD